MLLIVGCLLLTGIEPAWAQRKSGPKSTTLATGSILAMPGETTVAKSEQEALFTDGMRYIMTDEPTKALAQFEKLLQKDPTNAATQYAIASALMKSGKTTEALPFATKAYQLDKTNKFYGLQLAELYVKQKRYAEAETIYENILKTGADNAEYGVELAAIYLFDDKPDKALETYDKVEKAMGMNEEITRQKQRIYLKQNKIDLAVAEAEKLIATEPGDDDYLIEGAELLIANDRPPQAIGWLEKALKINPDNAQAHIMLADIYQKQGNLQKCSQELTYVFANPNLDAGSKARVLASYVNVAGDNVAAKQDALRLARELGKNAPNEPKAQVMLADLLLQQNQKAEARTAYLQAAKADPSVYEVWGAILQIDSDLNQMDSLLTHSEKALEVFPTQGLFWYSNGIANLARKSYQPAVDALEESRKLSGKDAELTTAINAQLGDAYNALGDNAKSDEAYELALKQDPLNDLVMNNYSYFLSLRNEKLDRALQLSTKLVERNPTNPTFLDTHAWVLYIRKDYVKARQFLEKAVATDPNTVSGTIIEHYGDVLFQTGDREKAVEQWKRAKAKGDTSDALDKKITTGNLHE